MELKTKAKNILPFLGIARTSENMIMMMKIIELALLNFEEEITSVQSLWSCFENHLIPIPDAFASFFKTKITNIVNESQINNNVYNGTRKVNVNDENFMNETNVKDAIVSIKIKNCEVMIAFPNVFW